MKIAAVIVTFNRKSLLLQTIKSLKNQSRKIDNIYIIDNESTDGTYDELVNNGYVKKEEYDKSKQYKSKTDNITYIRLPENSGGAGGFYEGIKVAHIEGNDWIWVMDDDVCPRLDALANYEKFILSSDRELGALMGVRYFDNKPFSFEAKKHDFENCFSLNFKKETVEISDIEKGEPIRIYDLPFEGPIINSKVIDKIGYPKKELFIIGDDTDYALRINQIAPIYTIPDVKIDRMIDPNVDYVFGWKDFYTLRNFVYLNKKYGANKGVKYIRTLNLCIRHLLPNIKRLVLKLDLSYMKKISKICEAYLSGISGKLGRKYLPGDF